MIMLVCILHKVHVAWSKKKATVIITFINTGVEYMNQNEHQTNAALWSIIVGFHCFTGFSGRKTKCLTMREVQSKSGAVHPFTYNFHFTAL